MGELSKAVSTAKTPQEAVQAAINLVPRLREAWDKEGTQKRSGEIAEWQKQAPLSKDDLADAHTFFKFAEAEVKKAGYDLGKYFSDTGHGHRPEVRILMAAAGRFIRQRVSEDNSAGATGGGTGRGFLAQDEARREKLFDHPDSKKLRNSGARQ